MKQTTYKLTILLAIIFHSILCFSQEKEIKIHFIGNCGLHMTDGNIDVYMDFPYKSGAFGYMEYDKSFLDSIPENSIFIFTHKHADHYSKKVLKTIIKERNGKAFTQWKSRKLKKFSNTISDFDVQLVKTKHRFSLKHNSILLTWHGKRLFFSGDTEDPKILERFNNIDLAFISPWLYKYGQNRNIRIDAKKTALYHLYPSNKIDDEYASDLLVLKNQGEIITLPYQIHH